MPRPPVLAQAPVLPSGLQQRRQLLQRGWSPAAIAKAVANERLRRVTLGVYGPPGPPAPNESLRAAAYAADAVASGPTAARLHGWELVHDPTEHHLTIPRDARRQAPAGSRLSRRDLADGDVERVAGLRRTTALRTVLDCCRELPLNEAVAAADSALRAGAVTVPELRAAAVTLPRGPGRAGVRRALALVDPEADSVLESCFRVLMHEHGLAPDDTQLTLRLPNGRRIVRADFIWLHCRLVVETDGFESHRTPSAQRHDAWVNNRLQAAGWHYLRFTWFDVMHQPDEVVALVRTMLGLGCPR